MNRIGQKFRKSKTARQKQGAKSATIQCPVMTIIKMGEARSRSGGAMHIGSTAGANKGAA